MDGCACPEVELDEWSAGLLAPLHDGRYPLSGTFELTERCNLSCVHCYINQPAGSQAARARELTTAQATDLMDQMADAGCLFLLLTGGEVLIRPDFPAIYRHARRRGMLTVVFTNGTLLTPELADVLAEIRPRSIEITLYGATAATYERVTRVPGSYARCRRGIELLLARGLPLSLKAILLTTSRHELPEMQALAAQLGVRFRYDGMLWPRLDGDQRPFDYRLSVKEMVNLDYADVERQCEWDRMARTFGGRPVRAENVYCCGAGLRSFHVDCSGRLTVCTMARMPHQDLRQMSFAEGWERLGAVRQQKRQLNTPCRSCTVGGLCTQCPGWSQVVHGDDETPVEFVCELGRLRAERTQRTDLVLAEEKP